MHHISLCFILYFLLKKVNCFTAIWSPAEKGDRLFLCSGAFYPRPRRKNQRSGERRFFHKNI